MWYKEEVQKKNAEKLERKFQEENVPDFIQKYFINIESKAGAINYWIVIRDLLLWFMQNDIIDKKEISCILPKDFYNVEAEDITLYLKQKEQSGLSPTTLETRKNIFRSFWNYLKCTKKCPVDENIISYVTYKGISFSNSNLFKKLPSDEQLKKMEEKIMRKFAQQQLGHTSTNITINNYANGSYGMKEILKNM